MDSTMVNVPQLAGEVAGVKFGDERLTNRLVRVVEALGRRPIRSTTKAKHPGTQTHWLGLPRVNDLAIAWSSYGPGKITPTQKSLIPKKRCVVR